MARATDLKKRRDKALDQIHALPGCSLAVRDLCFVAHVTMLSWWHEDVVNRLEKIVSEAVGDDMPEVVSPEQLEEACKLLVSARGQICRVMDFLEDAAYPEDAQDASDQLDSAVAELRDAMDILKPGLGS